MKNTDGLLDILRCPQSKATLVRDGDRLVSTDEATRLAYPIRDDIPIMLADEATPLEPDEWRAAVERGGQDDA